MDAVSLTAWIDAEQRYQEVSAAYLAQLQLDPSQVIGHSLAAVHGAEQARLLGQALDAARAAGGHAFRFAPLAGGGSCDCRLYWNSRQALYLLIVEKGQAPGGEPPRTRRPEAVTLAELADRPRFVEILADRLALGRDSGEALAVLSVDLDRFQWVNETLGSQAGDALLQEVARRLGAVTRGADRLARLSGDEFALLLSGLDSKEDAPKVAQRVVEQLSRGIYLGHREVFISGSVGIACAPEHGQDAETLLRRADVAMHSAKQGGRNTFRLFQASMEGGKGSQLLKEADLARALREGQLQMRFLTIYSSQTHRADAIQALPCWQHPVLGLLQAEDFLPLLQAPGNLRRYQAWLADELKALNDIWQHFTKLKFLSLELPLALFERTGSTLHWLEGLQARGIELDRLMLEVEAREAIHSEGVLFDLQEAGLLLALSGVENYNLTLQQMRDLEPDLLRLNHRLVAAQLRDEKKHLLVDSLLEMAEILGIAVLAEGVASAGQLSLLQSQGCRLMEGPYFGRLLNAEQMREQLVLELSQG